MHLLRHRFLLPRLGSPLPPQHALPQLPEVRVIGTTPLPDGGLPRRQIPAAVQTLDTPRRFARRPHHRRLARPAPEACNLPSRAIPTNRTRLPRFTASPVLGTARGLSVYMDGVRRPALRDVVNGTDPQGRHRFDR